MTRRRSWLWLGAVITAFGVTVSGCGLGQLGATSSEDDEQLSDRGVLRISHDLSWGGQESLDPSSSSPMTWATTLLYDGLVRRGPDARAVAGLAHEWWPNSDATEWNFILAADVTYHDGSSMDADDVKYTFERLANSETSPIAGSLSTLESVEVVNDLNVTFHLTEPAVDFPFLLTDRRMRVLSSESPIGVGTGPFRIDTFDPENTALFRAFDDYFLGRPQLAAVEIVAMPEASGRLAAIEIGRLDLLGDLSANDVEFLVGRPGFDLQLVPSGDWRGLVFDTTRAPFDDPRVIRALKLIVDRDEMIELVAGGRSGAEVSCDSPVWSGDPYHSPSSCPPNIEQAQELLADAGFRNGLDFTITTSSLYGDWIPLAEVFQYQAAQAGVRVDIEIADAAGYWSDVWMQEPVTTTSWTQRTSEQILTEAFLSDAQWNESRWDNPEFDALVRAATAEANPERRAELYAEAVALIRSDGGTIIPYHVKRSRVVADRVQGVENGVDQFRVPWHLVSVTSP